MKIDVDKEIEKINHELRYKTQQIQQLENTRQQLINEALMLQGVLNYLNMLKEKEKKKKAKN